MQMPLSIRVRTFPFRVVIWFMWRMWPTQCESNMWSLVRNRFRSAVDEALAQSEANVRVLEAVLRDSEVSFKRATISIADESLDLIRLEALHPIDLIPALHAKFEDRLRAEPVHVNVWPH